MHPGESYLLHDCLTSLLPAAAAWLPGHSCPAALGRPLNPGQANQSHSVDLRMDRIVLCSHWSHPGAVAETAGSMDFLLRGFNLWGPRAPPATACWKRTHPRRRNLADGEQQTCTLHEGLNQSSKILWTLIAHSLSCVQLLRSHRL